MLIFDASTLILPAKTELPDKFLDSFGGEVLTHLPDFRSGR